MLRIEDNWQDFVNALKERFTNSIYKNNAMQELDECKYQGDISDYVTKMKSLNVDVGWTEFTWQRALLKDLDQEMFYWFGNVKKPTNDDEFEDLLLEIKQSLE